MNKHVVVVRKGKNVKNAGKGFQKNVILKNTFLKYMKEKNLFHVTYAMQTFQERVELMNIL